MLQLHRSGKQLYCPQRCVFYIDIYIRGLAVFFVMLKRFQQWGKEGFYTKCEIFTKRCLPKRYTLTVLIEIMYASLSKKTDDLGNVVSELNLNL